MKKLIVLNSIIIFLSSCHKDGDNLPKLSEINIPIADTHILKAKIFNNNNSNYFVVLESGLGDGLSVWEEHKLANKIAEKSDILIYNRAGYAQSTIDNLPRNVEKLRQELEAVINHSANGRPLILIGHSYGGLIIRDFAVINPHKIAGLLFVDTSHELYNLPLSQEKEDMVYNQLLAFYGANHGSTREARELNESLTYMLSVGNLPNIPVIVLTSMKLDANNISSDQFNGKTREDWYNAHNSLKTGVDDFTHVQTFNSGHYIMREEPNLFMNNFNALMSKL